VQDAGAAALDRCGMSRSVDAVAGASTPVELDALVVQNASNMPIAFDPPPTHAMTASGKPADLVEQLRSRLFADDLLEVATIAGNGWGPAAVPKM
jgi:hypothetical protein